MAADLHLTNLLLVALAAFAAHLWRCGGEGRPWARRIAILGGWQLATGLSTVVLGWPLLAAVAHTGGAAALATCLAVLLARLHQGHRAEGSTRVPAAASAGAAP